MIIAQTMESKLSSTCCMLDTVTRPSSSCLTHLTPAASLNPGRRPQQGPLALHTPPTPALSLGDPVPPSPVPFRQKWLHCVCAFPSGQMRAPNRNAQDCGNTHGSRRAKDNVPWLSAGFWAIAMRWGRAGQWAGVLGITAVPAF